MLMWTLKFINLPQPKCNIEIRDIGNRLGT